MGKRRHLPLLGRRHLLFGFDTGVISGAIGLRLRGAEWFSNLDFGVG